MDRFINLSLLAPRNLIAVGAIMFFWACVVYALQAQFAPIKSETG